MNPGQSIFNGVIGFQKPGHIFKTLSIQILVHGQRHGGELGRFLPIIINPGRKIFSLYVFHKPQKLVLQHIPLPVFQSRRRTGGFQEGTMTEFLGHGRGKAGQGGVNRFTQRRGLRADRLDHFRRGGRERIEFILRMGNKISPSRENLPYRADSQRHVLDAVQNGAVFPAED